MQPLHPTPFGLRLGNCAGHWIVWLTCVVMLPLPMPTMHRHDQMESSHSLESHLSQRHGNVVCELLPIDEPHWHFVMPMQNHDDDHQDDETPHPPADYIASQLSCPAASMTASSSSPADFAGSFLGSCGRMKPQGEYPAMLDPSMGLAKAAIQSQRSALSCVMRC